MAKLLKLRRGTTSQHSSFTGAEGEVTIDTTKDTAVVHDGSQAGGRPLLREDLSNLGTGAVATAKIADEAITLAKLEHGTSSNDGKFLRANNGADPTFETITVPASINNLVEDTSPQLGGSLDVNSKNVNFGDSSGTGVNRIRMGASTDLQIWHDGSNSYIQDSGTGNLVIQATDFRVSGYNTGENFIKGNENGAVELYYDSGKKLETVTGGVTVTGTLTATALAGDGSALTGIAGIPSGVIAIWSGATSAIPSGWVICDGNNSTPDLRDRFVLGATAGTGDTSLPGVSPGATGGGFSGSMTVSVNGNTGWASQYANASSTPNASPEPFNSRDRHQHGWGGNFSHSYDKTPPFYALAFIMKS